MLPSLRSILHSRVFFFCLGAASACAAMIFLCGNITANALRLIMQGHLEEMRQRVALAYKRGEASVALWELGLFSKKLQEARELNYEDQHVIELDELLTHIRLAQTYSKIGQTNAADIHFGKASASYTNIFKISVTSTCQLVELVDTLAAYNACTRPVNNGY